MKLPVLLFCLIAVRLAGQLSISGNVATFGAVDTPYVNNLPVPFLIDYCDSLRFSGDFSAVFFLDASSSMSEAADQSIPWIPFQPHQTGQITKLELAKLLVQQIKDLQPIKQIGVLSGNTRNKVVSDLTFNKNIDSALMAVVPSGSTSIYNMLANDTIGVIEMSKRAIPKRFAILVTDGIDYAFPGQAILDSCLKYNITLHVLLVTQDIIPFSCQPQLRQMALATGGVFIWGIDTTVKIPFVIDSFISSVNHFPCKIRFPLDECAPSWHIQIGSFDSVVLNPNFQKNNTFVFKRDTLYFKPCQKDSLITIHGKSYCRDTVYALSVTQSGEFAEVIKNDTFFVAYKLPDTLYTDPCKLQTFTVTRTRFYCDSTVTDSATFPYGQPSYTFDTTFSVVFISAHKDSLVFDTSYHITLSICDTGFIQADITNPKCLPAILNIKGAGAFECNDSVTTVPAFTRVSVLFRYFPTGKDTSVFTFNGTPVYFYGEGIDSTYTIRPDTIAFTRTVCDSTPEFYSIKTISCDTSTWDGAFIPSLTKGIHSDSLDGIHFIYTVTDSTREEFYLDSCGGGYSLKIGCDTTVLYYTPTIDTVRGFITHEYQDTQHVKLTVHINTPYYLTSSSEMFVLDRDEGTFYLGKDSFAVVTITVFPEPCKVYLLKPDTIYYQMLCGDDLLRKLLNQTTFRIYPNPTTGEFSISPKPKSVELFYDGRRVNGITNSGVYVIMVDGVVLKLVVRK